MKFGICSYYYWHSYWIACVSGSTWGLLILLLYPFEIGCLVGQAGLELTMYEKQPRIHLLPKYWDHGMSYAHLPP